MSCWRKKSLKPLSLGSQSIIGINYAARIVLLCVSRVVLPFTLKHLEENHDGFVVIQINTFINFITFHEGYPLGSIEEVDEVIESNTNQENLSGEDNANNVASKD